MEPHKTVVERGDTYAIELNIRAHQPEGWYEYIPDGGDVITVYIKHKDTLVNQMSYETPEGNRERISVVVPTDLPEGCYTYDVIIVTSDGEKHTICDECILKIKEDGTHA